MKILNFREKYRNLELAHGYDLYNSEALADLLEEVIHEYEQLVKACMGCYPEGIYFDNQPEEHWIDPFTNEPYTHVSEEYIRKWSKNNG